MKFRNSYQMDVDPVCGMRVDQHKTDQTTQYEGRAYSFCAESCRKKFDNQPQKYIGTKRKSFWERYLERLNRATGGKTPKCCG